MENYPYMVVPKTIKIFETGIVLLLAENAFQIIISKIFLVFQSIYSMAYYTLNCVGI